MENKPKYIPYIQMETTELCWEGDYFKIINIKLINQNYRYNENAPNIESKPKKNVFDSYFRYYLPIQIKS